MIDYGPANHRFISRRQYDSEATCHASANAIIAFGRGFLFARARLTFDEFVKPEDLNEANPMRNDRLTAPSGAAIAAALSAVIAAACASAEPVEGKGVASDTDARALHERLLTLDSHLDTPAVLERPGFDIMARHSADADYAQVDVPRMREGALDGGFWVIYTRQGPLTPEAYEDARDSALMRAVAIQKMVAANPETFALATGPEDAERIASDGKIVVYQSIENAYPLGEDLSLLETFYKLGVRMVGPVHFANNQFSDSSTDPDGTVHGGLSDLGKDLVREANRLGMIVDASHAHDLALDDMLEVSATPIILSHSGAKAIYDHPRNVDDARLKAVAEGGGVIQMNAFGGYLTELKQSEERQAAYRELWQDWDALGPDAGGEAYQAVLERRRQIDAEYPADMAEFADYMDHFLHVLWLVGADHVGVGADWDGGGGVIGMNDAAAVPAITARLLEEGYSEEDLAKIWGGNMLRLLGEVQAHAEAMASGE